MRLMPPHVRQVASGGSSGAKPAACPLTNFPVARSRSFTSRMLAPHSVATATSSGVCTSTTASSPSSVHVSSSADKSGSTAAATSSIARAPSHAACAICSGSTMRSLAMIGIGSSPPADDGRRSRASAHASFRSRDAPPYEVRSVHTSAPTAPSFRTRTSASVTTRSDRTGSVTPSRPVGEARFRSAITAGRSGRHPIARPSAHEDSSDG
mmetsp:Transcript_1260/g.3545  ORF Transcript_1260/g.3545 Transcript_1260/m.3545 type:complete len:210 (+) Transcript_1260:384-1013(+)